jgi:hypothetical protein
MRDVHSSKILTLGTGAFFSFYPITVFPILEAPQWTKGYTVNIVFILCYWSLFLLGQYLWRRDEQTKKFDINAHSNEDEFQKPDAVHVEVVDEKETKETKA